MQAWGERREQRIRMYATLSDSEGCGDLRAAIKSVQDAQVILRRFLAQHPEDCACVWCAGLCAIQEDDPETVEPGRATEHQLMLQAALADLDKHTACLAGIYLPSSPE